MAHKAATDLAESRSDATFQAYWREGRGQMRPASVSGGERLEALRARMAAKVGRAAAVES